MPSFYSPFPPVPTRVVVIGGGIAGLATAALLAKNGYAVTLLEKNQQLGGRTGRLSAGGFTWDTGPSWFLMPEAFDHFYEAMGTSTAKQLDLIPLDPAYRVFTEGLDPVDVPSGIERIAAVFEGIEPGAGAAVTEYLEQAALSYELAVRHFLYTTFSSLRPFLTRELLGHLGLLATLLLGSLESLSADRFQDVRLRQILQYPAVFLATTPRRAPALYHLLSYTDLVDAVRYPQGGFGTVIDSIAQLARDNGVKIRTGACVESIMTCGRTARGVVFRDAATGRTERIEADVVVSAADKHHTDTHLLPPPLQSPERAWQSRDPGISAVLVYLGVRGRLPELIHHQLLLSQQWEQDFARMSAPASAGVAADGSNALDFASESIYVCAPSKTDPHVAPEGDENLFVLVPTAALEELGHGSISGEQSAAVEKIAAHAVEIIARRAGIADLSSRIVQCHTMGPADFAAHFHAWRGSALGLAHTLRQSAFLRGSNKSDTVTGLYYAGSTTLPGVGLPMCLISAENVLTRLRQDGIKN